MSKITNASDSQLKYFSINGRMASPFQPNSPATMKNRAERLRAEAIKNPEWVERTADLFPGRVVVGIDARNGLVAIEGWTENTRTRAIDLAKRFENCGVAAINFTDIHRDGMQTGPNIEETRKLAEAIEIPVVASGGVATIDDIRNLLPLEPVGVIGVITGKALYTGSLDFEEALALTKSIEIR